LTDGYINKYKTDGRTDEWTNEWADERTLARSDERKTGMNT